MTTAVVSQTAIAPPPTPTVKELDKLLARFNHKGQAFVESWADLAIATARFVDAKQYKELGYRDIGSFLECYLGFSRSQGDRMLAAGRRAVDEGLTGADFANGFHRDAFLVIGTRAFAGHAKEAIALLPQGGTKRDLENALQVAQVTDSEYRSELTQAIETLSQGYPERDKSIRKLSLEIARDRGGGHIYSWEIGDVEEAAQQLEDMGWQLPQRRSPKKKTSKVPSSGSSQPELKQSLVKLSIAIAPMEGTVLECCDDASNGEISRSLEDWEGTPTVLTNALKQEFDATFHHSATKGDLWEHLNENNIEIDWVVAAPPSSSEANCAAIARHALSTARCGVALLLPCQYLVSEHFAGLLSEWSDCLSLIRCPRSSKLWFVWSQGNNLKPFVF